MRAKGCLEDLVALGREQLSPVEHGPSVGDEVNLVTAGGNYGWDPQRGYDASVPMTDLEQFAAAIEARCSSSDPALATSDGIFLEGAAWRFHHVYHHA